MLGFRARHIHTALTDLKNGFYAYSIWVALAFNDISDQYKRTTIGPFWITLSTLIMILTFGILYGTLMNRAIEVHLPYVACGIVFWNFFQAMAITGCNIFSINRLMIQQIPLPLSTYIYKLVATNLINLAHNALIILVIVVIFVRPSITANIIYLFPGFLILLLASFGFALFLAVFSTRFRDLPEIVQGVFRPMMFITPVIWSAELMPERAKFVDLNIFYHLIEIVRAPILGKAPSFLNWTASIGFTIFMLMAAVLLFIRYRHRIAYWV